MSQTTHTQTDGTDSQAPLIERVSASDAERLAVKRTIRQTAREIEEFNSPHKRAHQRVLCRMYFERRFRTDISQYPLGQE